MIFTTIILPLISTITVILAAFHLSEVIVYHYVHLNQPLTLGDIPSLLIFLWNSVALHILNDLNCKSFRHSLYSFMCIN